MRQHDGHVRKVHGHIVDGHRVAVFQADTAAPGHASADTAVTGVKEDRQPRFGEDFVEGIGDPVVGPGTLNRRDAASGRAPVATSLFASRTASAPRVGLMLTKGSAMSAFCAANSMTASLDRRGVPVNVSSTVKMTHAIFPRPVRISASDARRARRRP